VRGDATPGPVGGPPSAQKHAGPVPAAEPFFWRKSRRSSSSSSDGGGGSTDAHHHPPPLAALRLLLARNAAAAALAAAANAAAGTTGRGNQQPEQPQGHEQQQHQKQQQPEPLPHLFAAFASSPPSPPHPQRRPSSRQSRRGVAASSAPHSSALCCLVLALGVAILFLQAISCGFFFCMAPGLPPLGSRPALPWAALSRQQQQQQRGLKPPPLSASATSAAAAAAVAAALLGDGPAAGLGAEFGEILVPLGGGGGGGGDSDVGAAATSASATAATATTPRLIPRVLHQTWPAQRSSPQRRALARTCARAAGQGWTFRVWDDASAAALVQAFPEYVEAYAALPRDVERADLFRYLALLHFGGVFVDTDVECLRPLDDVILPADTLVAGWGAFFAADGGGGGGGGGGASASPDGAAGGVALPPLLPRERTLATWMLASAPGHPALRELCERVARGASATFSAASAVRDTAERTGAGALTDVLLRHAVGGGAGGGDLALATQRNGTTIPASSSSPAAPLPSKATTTTKTIPGGGAGVVSRGGRPHSGQDPWRVRILPLVAFGAASEGSAAAAAVTRTSPGVVAVHHAMGTWEGKAEARAAAALSRRAEAASAASAAPSSSRNAAAVRTGLRPDPPLGLPDGVPFYPVAVAFDPPFSALVPQSYASAVVPSSSRDASAAAVGASLLIWGDWQPGVPAYRRPTLLEAVVGALATRTGAPGSMSSSSGSSSIQAEEPTQQQQPATLVDAGAGLGLFSLAAAARGHRAVAIEPDEAAMCALRAAVAHNGFGALVTPVAAGVVERTMALTTTTTTTLARLLGNDTSVGALRIGSLNGHEARALDGALPYLRRVRRPAVVAVEMSAGAMAAAGDPAGPERLLALLHGELGYRDVAHAGPLCDERWRNATAGLRGGGGSGGGGSGGSGGGSPGHSPHSSRPPTWCRLPAAEFGAFLARARQLLIADGSPPESLLFMLPLPPDGGGGSSAAG
jgi:hypothetical protein